MIKHTLLATRYYDCFEVQFCYDRDIMIQELQEMQNDFLKKLWDPNYFINLNETLKYERTLKNVCENIEYLMEIPAVAEIVSFHKKYSFDEVLKTEPLKNFRLLS